MRTELGQAPADYARWALWLALINGLIVSVRGTSPSFAFVGKDFRIWLYVASLVAHGLSLILALLVLAPEMRVKLGARFRGEPGVFAWACALFALAVALTIAAAIELAFDARDGRPFN